jgi:hypothetical protein
MRRFRDAHQMLFGMRAKDGLILDGGWFTPRDRDFRL